MDKLNGTRPNTPLQSLKSLNVKFEGNKNSKVNFTDSKPQLKTQPCKDEVCFAGPLTGGTR